LLATVHYARFEEAEAARDEQDLRFHAQRVRQYDDFETYRAQYQNHALYPFMLDGATDLQAAAAIKKTPYALVFGNEGAGLPPAFAGLGQAVKIRQSAAIDSLNLAISVAIAAYAFTAG